MKSFDILMTNDYANLDSMFSCEDLAISWPESD